MNKELLKRFSETLAKFNTLENLNCDFTDKNELVAQFTITNTKVLYRIMKALFSGSIEWECDLSGWMDHGVFASFYISLDGMDEDTLKRELDYKVCMLTA